MFSRLFVCLFLCCHCRLLHMDRQKNHELDYKMRLKCDQIWKISKGLIIIWMHSIITFHCVFILSVNASLFHVEKLSQIHGLYIFKIFVFVIVEECGIFIYFPHAAVCVIRKEVLTHLSSWFCMCLCSFEDECLSDLLWWSRILPSPCCYERLVKNKEREADNGLFKNTWLGLFLHLSGEEGGGEL